MEDKMRETKLILLMLLLGATVLNAGYITPPLQAVLDTLSPKAKTRVCVHLVEKPNLSRFPQKAYTAKIKYLKEFAHRKQTALIEFTNSYGNLVENVRSFWVFSGFTFRGTKNVIIAVAARPEVEFVSGGIIGDIKEPFGYGPPPPEREWNIERVGANQVWLHGYTGDGIVICIFDTGMLINHESWWTDEYNHKWRLGPEPNPWYYAWHDEDPEQPSGTPIDYCDWGHGTFVGGIAIGGDGYTTPLRDIGVAPGAKLIACTHGTDITFDGFHGCFQWIAELTNTPYGNLAPDVVNCSWGAKNGWGTSIEFWEDILTLRNLGIISVFCIGNYGPPNDPNWPPGNYPTTIGVGATDYDDVKADFSLTGYAPNQEPWNEEQYWSRPDWQRMAVDLVAPGTKYEYQEIGIYSADKNDPLGYKHGSGTSAATPHVTGAIALMLQASKEYWGYEFDYYTIYDILVQTADPVGQGVPNIEYGWGRLDCKAAVESVWTFHLKSSTPSALANNNQRKTIYFPTNNTIHLVYQVGRTLYQMGTHIRYTCSADNGQTWSIEENPGEGEAPCLALDNNGNPHCVFKDAGMILYNRRINDSWLGPDTIYNTILAWDILPPSFVIYGNDGYVGFEAYGEAGSDLNIGTFDITATNPVLEYINLDRTQDYRFGAPGLGLNQDGLHIVYTRINNGVREVFFRSSFNDWQLIPVSNQDGVASTNPTLICTPTKVWIFWEEDNPSDIYYRVWTRNGWENDPTSVFISPSLSCGPRAFYNTTYPDIIYVTWSEYVDLTFQWDIYVAAYANGWQNPINASNTPNVDSKDPDMKYLKRFNVFHL